MHHRATCALRFALAAAIFLFGKPGSRRVRPESSSEFPPRLESYLKTVKLGSSERQRLLDGFPVTKFLQANAEKEVAVFGAIWIDASMDRYVEAIQDIDHFETGSSFIATHRIGSPPTQADFASMSLPEQDLDDLKSCTVGNCELKLSSRGIEELRHGVDWSSADWRSEVQQRFREFAYGLVVRYIARGNEGLAVYRDAERPTFVASEFKSMVDRMPELTRDKPEIRSYLLNYPNVTLPNSSDFIYWQEVDFGLKPTIRINHVVIREYPDETVVASKMLYASHYFWTALELRILIPDASRGPGFWLVTDNRSRSDGLNGFFGWAVRRRIRSAVSRGVLDSLTATKNKTEATAP